MNKPASFVYHCCMGDTQEPDPRLVGWSVGIALFALVSMPQALRLATWYEGQAQAAEPTSIMDALPAMVFQDPAMMANSGV
ncbi:MAG: hypothetical protein ABI743_08040 [bacterium]